MSTSHQRSAITGVVFSGSKLPESQTSTVIGNEPDSTKVSPAPSIRYDTEKGERIYEEDLASYLVPALEKGRKNALLKPPSLWIKFRVWYNPYRMVRPKYPLYC